MKQVFSTVAFTVFATLLAISDMNPAVAQQAERPPTVRPGEIECTASRVFTLVQGTGIGHSHGVEAKFATGGLVLGATANAGRFVIDTRSFDADTMLARKHVGLGGKSAEWMRKQVNKEIHSATILDSEKFPTATFDIVSAIPTGFDEDSGRPIYELAGKFTLRGVSNSITIPVVVEMTDGWLHLKGRFSFKQSDYGITPLSKAFGSIGVADELTVFGEMWLVPTPASLASYRSTQARR